jgi:DNA-binding MarR family transcriptional regulator
MKAEKDGLVAGDVAVIERELMRLARAMEAVQRKRRYPLERAEFIILRTLIEGGPLGVGQLARQLLLDDSTMTRQVAALQEKGLVARRADPGDGRASIVDATAAGEARFNETLEQRVARIDQYVEGWSAAEREAFGALLGRFNGLLFDALAV